MASDSENTTGPKWCCGNSNGALGCPYRGQKVVGPKGEPMRSFVLLPSSAYRFLTFGATDTQRFARLFGDVYNTILNGHSQDWESITAAFHRAQTFLFPAWCERLVNAGWAVSG